MDEKSDKKNKQSLKIDCRDFPKNDEIFELCSKICGMRQGRNINIVSAVAANILSQRFSYTEVEILALFFNALADDLETIVDTSSVICEASNSLSLPQPTSELDF